jgi:hypothetical protein
MITYDSASALPNTGGAPHEAATEPHIIDFRKSSQLGLIPGFDYWQETARRHYEAQGVAGFEKVLRLLHTKCEGRGDQNRRLYRMGDELAAKLKESGVPQILVKDRIVTKGMFLGYKVEDEATFYICLAIALGACFDGRDSLPGGVA